MGCEPIRYVSLSDEITNASTNAPTEVRDVFREGVQYFTDNLSSDKLDLVIVLDVQKGMEKFYNQNIFGSDFLDQFKDFDWRVAYTNTGISSDLILNDKDQKESKKSSGCKKLLSKGLLSSVAGALLESPHFLFTGLNSFTQCVSNVRHKRKQKKSNFLQANGDFLKFEHKRKQIQLNGNYLTKEVENYNSIFNDTMFYNKKRNYRRGYEAPVIQGETSNPFLSILFSFSKKINEQSSNKFFRKDSRVVYIVVTPEDGKVDIKKEEFKKALEHSLKGQNRFQLIPVTLQPESVFCKVKFQEMGVKEPTPAVYLQKMAKSFDVQSLDICSPNLGEQLATEIKTNLHSTNIL